LVAQIAFEDVEQVFANDAIDQPADDDTPSVSGVAEFRPELTGIAVGRETPPPCAST
jgi:hypothetical protein